MAFGVPLVALLLALSPLVYDLGSGDGRNVLLAAQKKHRATGVRIGIDSQLVRRARANRTMLYLWGVPERAPREDVP